MSVKQSLQNKRKAKSERRSLVHGEFSLRERKNQLDRREEALQEAIEKGVQERTAELDGELSAVNETLADVRQQLSTAKATINNPGTQQ